MEAAGLTAAFGAVDVVPSGTALATNLVRNPSVEAGTTDWEVTDGASMILDGAALTRVS